MASSEIEIVLDSNEHKPSNGNPNEVHIVDVFSASAYGDFEKLRNFVENDGVSLSRPDGNGYYPLQWPALNNFTDIVQYIIEVICQYNELLFAVKLVDISSDSGWVLNYVLYFWKRGGQVNAKDNSGQTALHWAAVRGSIAAADVLLQNGARVEAADVNGYRVTLGFCCDFV